MQREIAAGLMERIVSEEVFAEAYAWVCERRREYPPDADIWNLRRNWEVIKPQMQHDLASGVYTFSPLQQIRRDGEIRELWTAQDALVLKALALVLTERLAPVISPTCTHVAGNGGAKAAVQAVADSLEHGSFVMKSDVKDYYASIDHQILEDLLCPYVEDVRIQALVRAYLRRTVTFGGNYWEVTQGISLSCPLSPLMGALYLKPLDDMMAATGLPSWRFMDDWIIIAPTRWKLRKIVRRVNLTLQALRVKQHPDKTFIGRASRGVDFLGYHITPQSLTLAAATVQRALTRIARLYEHGADTVRIGQYVVR